MNALSSTIERLLLVSWQRWLFVTVAVVAAAAASFLAAVGEGRQSGIVLVIIVALAGAATVFPDSHAAVVAMGIVVWQWLASTDDALTPLAIPMALCLFVFHTVIALMAVTPISAHVDRSVVLRWTARGGYVALATMAVWLVVVVMNERQASGSAALTALGFVTLAVLLLATRSRSTPTDQTR